MTTLYHSFIASIGTADRNASIIFLIALGSVAAWYALELLPHRWQNPARILAWMYAILALGLTVYISI
jgi:hypothetical protein